MLLEAAAPLKQGNIKVAPREQIAVELNLLDVSSQARRAGTRVQSKLRSDYCCDC